MVRSPPPSIARQWFACKPREGLGQDNEFGNILALDDLDVDLTAGPLHAVLELRSPVAAVGVEFQQ